mgnify:FL=1
MGLSFDQKQNYRIEDLLRIMELLRGEGGCPWDREQTHQSIRNNLIEEAYEVVEAIDMESPEMLKEELGDLLLQVAFHSRMSEEAGHFRFDDVADGICKKLILRHPHIFGEVSVRDTEEVLDNWEEIKKREKGQKTATDAVKSVPRVFPALMRSQKVQKRAAKTGFDYPGIEMALKDLCEEFDELRQAIAAGDKPGSEEELGDLLFSVVNVARLIGIDAEESLVRSCDKFISRFEAVEGMARKRGLDLKLESIEAKNALWDEAKALQHNKNKVEGF